MPILIFLIQLSEDGIKAGKSSYLSLLTCVFSGFLPIVGAMVISVPTLAYIWKGVLCFAILVGFITSLRYSRHNIHFLYSFILTIGFVVFPFIYFGNLIPTAYSNIPDFFDDHFPLNLLSFWGPLFLFGILMGYILVPRDKGTLEQNRQSNRPSTNRLDASFENRVKAIDAQNASLRNQVKKLNEVVDQLQLQALVAKYPSVDNKTESKIGSMLTQLKDDIAILKTHASQYRVTEINVDQETLVRELSHFLATPLATIDASCSALQSFPLKGKDQTKLSDYFQRILASVKMCNGILGTYKEIFAGGKIEDSQRLPDMIKSSFEIFCKRENKQLKLQLNIVDCYPDVPNYYLLSLLLPLLSNAVTAAKNNTVIELFENNGHIIVANTFKDVVDLVNLEIEGYSSKPDHRGMGLYTVRHLLARRKLGGLSYYKKDNRIYFDVPIITNNEQPTN